MSQSGELIDTSTAASGVLPPSFCGALRPYQMELFTKARARNVIVHLPTGGGKTIIAAALAAAALDDRSWSNKVVMVVNRVPLVKQQQEVMRRHVRGASVAAIAGEKKDASSWAEVLQRFHIVVIIDSIFYSWLLTNSNTHPSMWNDIGLLIFDEVHNARKNSFFAKIAKQYMSIDPVTCSFPLRVVGLTASPGADVTETKTKQNIMELMQLTGCTMAAVTDEMDSLRAHVRVPKCTLIEFELASIEHHVELIVVTTIKAIEACVVCGKDVPLAFKTVFTCVGMPLGSMQYIVRACEIAAHGRGRDDPAMMHTALVLKKLNEGLILLGESGIHGALSYFLDDVEWCQWVFSRFDSGNPHYLKVHRLLGEIVCPFFARVYIHEPAWRRQQTNPLGTKMLLLVELIRRINARIGEHVDDEFRGIIFCQTKHGADQIVKYLRGTEAAQLNPALFVGHSRTIVDDTDGKTRVLSMTESQQQARLAEFRQGTVKLLVATSVAEEGLDIPNCNVIIRFDGELTVKSFIQTRGRARKAGSEYYALMRHGNESSSFLLACSAVKLQEAVVRGICQADTVPLSAAVHSGQPCWNLEPLHVLNALCHAAWFGAELGQSITSHVQGKSVTMQLKLSLPQVRGSVRILGKGVGQENQARKIASWWVCKVLTEALRIDLNAVMNRLVGAPMRTVVVHHPTVREGSAIASLRTSNGTGDSTTPHAAIVEYDAAEWMNLHPFEVLQKSMHSGRTPKVENVRLEDGSFEVKLHFYNPTTRSECAIRATGDSPISALGTASLEALRALGKPQIRATLESQFWVA